MADKTVICIETCRNCAQHQWNTRHDEKKYEQNFIWMQEALQSELPGIVVLKNQIPVEWKDQAAFKGKTAPLTKEILELIPYIGAFEVRHEGTVLFSKLQSGCWPNCHAVATYVKSYLDHQNAEKQGSPTEKRNFGITYTKSMVLLDKGGSSHQNFASTMPTKSKPMEPLKEDKNNKEEKKSKKDQDNDEIIANLGEYEAQEEEKHPPETQDEPLESPPKETQLSPPKESGSASTKPIEKEPTTTEPKQKEPVETKSPEDEPKNEPLPPPELEKDGPIKEDPLSKKEHNAGSDPNPEAIPSEKKEENPSKDIPPPEAPKQEEKKQTGGEDIIDNLADFGIEDIAEDT